MEEQSNFAEEGQRWRGGTAEEVDPEQQEQQQQQQQQEQDGQEDAEEEVIAAIGNEIANLKREIISFGDDLDSIKKQVCNVDREYREAQAENQNLLEKIRRRTTATTGSNNNNNPENTEPPLDPISVRLIGIQLASIMVYMGTLTKEITLEGKKVRQVSEKMFAKEEQIQQLEIKQFEKIHELEVRRDIERDRLDEIRRQQQQQQEAKEHQQQEEQEQQQDEEQEPMVSGPVETETTSDTSNDQEATSC